MDEEMNDVLNPSDDEKEEDEYVLFTQQDNAKAETKSVSNGDVVSEHEESTHTHLRTVINTQGSMESSSEEDNKSAQPDQVQVQFHDVLKDYVGDFGFYQILYTLHKSWSTCLACMYTLVTVFLAAVPEHRCDLRDSARAGFNCTEEQLFANFIPNEKRHGQILPSQCQYYNFSALSYNFSDVSISLDQCTMGNMSDLLPLVDCDKWKYDTSFYKSTIIDEWDLVCSRSDLAANANSVYWFGVMAGLLVGGHIADRYGRKPVGIIGYIFFLLFGIVSSFSPSYTVFLVLRFLAAMFKTWKEVGGGIAALEIIGESRRIIYFLFDHIGWCIGYFLMDLIAYYERRWRYLHMYIVLSDVIAFLLFTLWQEEALKELKIVAKRNRRLIPTNISLSLQKEKVKVNVIELFRWPNLRKVTLMLFYVWIAMGFTYYGISLHTGHLGGNNFVTFFISGMTDLISGFLAIWLYHRYGRVRPYGFGCIAGGVALVVSIFVPTDLSWVIITTAMVGKFLVNIPGTGTWLYTLETYPTSIRSIGVHTCSFAARVGAVGASYIGILAKINRTLPLLIFGVCSILSGIISLMLPETRGEPLKQTVEEGELFVKRNLCKSFPCYHRCRRGESTEYNLIQNLNKTKDETVERDALLSSEDDF